MEKRKNELLIPAVEIWKEIRDLLIIMPVRRGCADTHPITRVQRMAYRNFLLAVFGDPSCLEKATSSIKAHDQVHPSISGIAESLTLPSDPT
jgi:hypothetical protein